MGGYIYVLCCLCIGGTPLSFAYKYRLLLVCYLVFHVVWDPRSLHGIIVNNVKAKTNVQQKHTRIQIILNSDFTNNALVD